MKKATALLAIFLLLGRSSLPAMPNGFSWVNLESDTATMAKVRQALHDTSITAIREVGLKDGFALVMTASRESDGPTPDYDRWSIYSISLATGEIRLMVNGYGVTLLDWIGAAKDELAITYFDCWECEAATLFTTLRFKKSVGWMARWPHKTETSISPQPGAVVLMTDVGDPYDDNDVEQVFAVVAQPNDGFAVGSWVHTVDSKLKKISDEVKRYSVDPATGEDHVEQLHGSSALRWERQICLESTILSIHPDTGQKSKVCRSVMRATAPHSAASK